MNVILLLSALLAADAAADQAKADLEKLQGTWVVVAMKTDGKAAPAELIENARLTVKGDRITAAGILLASASECAFTLDCARRPKVIEFQAKGQTSKGIYLVFGDKLEICRNIRGPGAPTEFDAAAGSGRRLIELKRAK